MDTYLFKNIVENGFRKGPIIKCEKYSRCILALPTISKIPYICVALILKPCRKMWVRSATDNVNLVYISVGFTQSYLTTVQFLVLGEVVDGNDTK